MTQPKNASENSDEAQAIIVVGFDEKSKPRAARFAASQAALATKAANLMGLTVCPVTPALVELSKKLPGGRVYASGSGFIPNIKRPLFDKIVEASGITLPSAHPANSTTPSPTLPSSWDDIDVGKLVLIRDEPENGWWEAIVVGKSDDGFILRWQGAPKEKPRIRKVTELALLNVGVARE